MAVDARIGKYLRPDAQDVGRELTHFARGVAYGYAQLAIALYDAHNAGKGKTGLARADFEVRVTKDGSRRRRMLSW